MSQSRDAVSTADTLWKSSRTNPKQASQDFLSLSTPEFVAVVIAFADKLGDSKTSFEERMKIGHFLKIVQIDLPSLKEPGLGDDKAKLQKLTAVVMVNNTNKDSSDEKSLASIVPGVVDKSTITLAVTLAVKQGKVNIVNFLVKKQKFKDFSNEEIRDIIKIAKDLKAPPKSKLLSFFSSSDPYALIEKTLTTYLGKRGMENEAHVVEVNRRGSLNG